jgi:hypothetical protein
MAFENRKYVIIPSSEIFNIDFNEVLESAPGTCRYSADGTKTFVKYEGDQPQSVVVISSKSQEYSHDDILSILSSEEWTSPMEDL